MINDFVELDEMQKEWFKQMFANEIENIKGTISNERLIQKGCSTQEQISMQEENILRLVSYQEFLQDILDKIS